MTKHPEHAYIKAATLMVEAVEEELAVGEISSERLTLMCRTLKILLELASPAADDISNDGSRT